MNILIVDDDKSIREVIREYLVMTGYTVYEASNGLEALDVLKKSKIDLVILDVMMPKMDGITCAKKIRQDSLVPIIMLTAKSEEEDKLEGFDSGIQDYVTKPFSPKELMARIKVVINRTELKHNTHEFGKLYVDVTSRCVKINDEEIKLSPKEYDLLFYFIVNKGIALSRENLLINVWGYDFFGDDRTVDTHIKTLRSNLGEYREVIKTLRGVGYKFEYEK